jgi:glycosyltransferase involved in cell wall biosynthesis
VLFVTWSAVAGRAEEIAAALGGRACAVHPACLRGRRRAPLRYMAGLAVTVAALVRRRPRAVIATNPPVFPGLASWAYCRIAGVPLVLDSHPTAFGAKDNDVARRLLGVHRWMARRSAAVLVTTDDWVGEVAAWGGRGIVVHEAPPPWRVAPAGPPGERPTVLFVAVFASDEPVAEVVEAARALPDVDVVVTGDTARAPAGLVDAAPANVRFVGWVPGERYVALLAEADVVLTLTTEPTSVMRAAYEAVWAGRPCVLSDWPVLRELFPDAVACANDAAAIADALGTAIAQHGTLRSRAEEARARQLRRWADQLGAVRDVIGRPGSTGSPTAEAAATVDRGAGDEEERVG